MFVEQLLGLATAFTYARLDKPRFSPAHTVNGLRSDGKTEWRESDSVYGRGRHKVEGGKVKSIHTIPADMQAELLAIDAERETIKKRMSELLVRERAILEAAFKDGKQLSVKDCENAPY